MLSVTRLQDELGLNNDIRVEKAKTEIKPTHSAHRSVIQSLWDHFGDQRFGRKDFSPTFIPPKALPYTCLLDVELDEELGRENPTYRYRVFGTEMREIIGRDLARKTVKDLPKRSCRTYLTRLHDECFYQGKPIFSKAEIEYPRDIGVETDKLFIPLFDEGGETVQMILSVFLFNFGLHHQSDIELLTEPLYASEEFRVFDSLGQLQAVTNRGAELVAVSNG
jgi:hypothetical protein